MKHSIMILMAILIVFSVSSCSENNKTDVNKNIIIQEEQGAGNSVAEVFESAGSPDEIKDYCDSHGSDCESYCKENPSNRFCKRPPKR